MSLARDLHDELSDDLTEITSEIYSVIGRENLDPELRLILRKLQDGIEKLITLLRVEISDSDQSKAPVFSIEIRELISTLNKLVRSTNLGDLETKVVQTLTEILSFPETFLLGKIRRTAASYELTKRELEILRLLPSGQTSKAMAISLFLTESTIKTHAASLYRKLEVNNRTQAIAVALEAGLIKR